MGAAFPLALSRRLDRGIPRWKISLGILERGVLLGFFALYVQALRPYVLAQTPGFGTWITALVAFVLLFAVFSRLPEQWNRTVRWGIRIGGWIVALALLAFTHYPDGSGFSLYRSDIIIVVLTNMAVFGALVWLFTRSNILLRLGILGVLMAIRLSNIPVASEGWVHDFWTFSPVPWIYTLYYQQYLFIVIPGTIAGDLLLQWMKRPAGGNDLRWSNGRHILLVLLMGAMVIAALVGLKLRAVPATTLVMAALLAAAGLVVWKPLNETERLYRNLFLWAAYWLVLGLFFEPYEGGIKKDHPTMSYYFITSGLAICTLIGFSVLIDVFERRRWLQLLIDNGQNPMVAYAGVNNFIIPVLGVTGLLGLMNTFAVTPWLGFLKGVVITLLLALFTAWCTRRKIFWRT